MFEKIHRLLLAATFSLCAFEGHAAVTYRVTDLSDSLLTGNGAFPSDINNSGQVIGVGYVSDSHGPIIWSPTSHSATVAELPSGMNAAELRGVNSSGQIVGIGYDNNYFAHAYRWSASGETQSLSLPKGTYANDINDNGQVVGSSLSNGRYQAYVWSAADGMRQLRGPTDPIVDSNAQAINNVGQVVGVTWGANPSAFIWTAESGIQSIGYLPSEYGWGTGTFASDINDAGQVIGSSNDKAFLWSAADGMQDLGDLPGVVTSQDIAYGINAHGLVVGTSSNDSFAGSQGFLWSQQAGMVSLTDLIDPSDPLHARLNIREALAINDAGQIVVSGFIDYAPNRAFLLTPIPEPSSIQLMLFGLIGIGALIKKRNSQSQRH